VSEPLRDAAGRPVVPILQDVQNTMNGAAPKPEAQPVEDDEE
jgi:hypothetical protein